MIRESIGKAVPIRQSYTRGEWPILVSIDGDLCTVRYGNRATLSDAPIRDLVDDSINWIK